MPCSACGKKLALAPPNRPVVKSSTFRMGFTRFRTTTTTQTTQTKQATQPIPKAFTLGF